MREKRYSKRVWINTQKKHVKVGRLRTYVKTKTIKKMVMDKQRTRSTSVGRIIITANIKRRDYRKHYMDKQHTIRTMGGKHKKNAINKNNTWTNNTQ